jgi:hypothetical protein
MTQRLLFILGIILLASTSIAQVATPLTSQDESSGRTQLYNLLKIVPTPRAAAMGNSFVAMKNDPNTIFSNPAALSSQSPRDSTAPGTILSLAASPLGVGITQGSIAFSAPAPEMLGENSWIGVGVLYNSYGTFKGADNIGQLTGDFTAGDFVLSVAYSGVIPEKPFHYGIALKFISSSLASGIAGVSGSSGLAADLGVYYESKPLLLTIGLSATNIGKELTYYDGIKEALPFNLQIGFSKKLERLPLTIHFAFHNLTRDREGRNLFYALNDFSIGGEFVISKIMRLRFGYENQERRDLQVPEGIGLGGFSVGLGMALKKLQLDYSLSIMGPVKADIHRFGGTYLF